MNNLRLRVPDSLIFGRTAGMQIVRQKVDSLRNTDIPVFLRGESGVGKETLAFALHSRGSTDSQRFVKVNCAAASHNFLEDETLKVALGGFRAGEEARPGRPESSAAYTLFADNIAELDATQQRKFLQMLLEAEGRGTGNNVPGIRIVCATSRDLETEVEAGQFRHDLFYRISAFDIWLPPLRQRTEDIPDLVEYFLKLYAEKNDTQSCSVSAQLLELMQRYHWPGNIRELENLVRRYLMLGSEQIVAGELLLKLRSDINQEPAAGERISLKKLTRQVTRDAERRLIVRVLENSGWNRKLAAQSLSISYRALLYKIKQGGMPAKRGLVRKASPPVAEER